MSATISDSIVLNKPTNKQKKYSKNKRNKYKYLKNEVENIRYSSVELMQHQQKRRVNQH